MTQRERLIELLGNCQYWGTLASTADYLLENGVIVPPCKVEQSIYALGNQLGVWQIKECEAEEFVVDKRRGKVSVHFECDNDCEGCPFNSWAQEYSGEWSCWGEYGQSMIGFEAFGDWVFLTREEAERALKERAEL